MLSLLLAKMTLYMEQQITIAAWAIAYDHDNESVRRATRDFNVSLLPRLWENGENDCWKRKASRKVNLLDGLAVGLMQQQQEGSWKHSTLSQKNRPAKLPVSFACHSSMFRALCREKYIPFKPILRVYNKYIIGI